MFLFCIGALRELWFVTYSPKYATWPLQSSTVSSAARHLVVFGACTVPCVSIVTLIWFPATTMGKSSSKTLFQIGLNLWMVQKYGRNENIERDYLLWNNSGYERQEKRLHCTSSAYCIRTIFTEAITEPFKVNAFLILRINLDSKI